MFENTYSSRNLFASINPATDAKFASRLTGGVMITLGETIYRYIVKRKRWRMSRLEKLSHERDKSRGDVKLELGCGRVPYWGNADGFCVTQIRRSMGKRAGGVAGDGEDDRRTKLGNCEDDD